MLDKNCPYTKSCPLMTHRDGREYSVAIGKYLDEVENEEEESEDEVSTKTHTGGDFFSSCSQTHPHTHHLTRPRNMHARSESCC